MRKYGIASIWLALFICIFVSGCGNKRAAKEFVDGYYTATMSDYSFGWKEYVTICVMNR